MSPPNLRKKQLVSDRLISNRFCKGFCIIISVVLSFQPSKQLIKEEDNNNVDSIWLRCGKECKSIVMGYSDVPLAKLWDGGVVTREVFQAVLRARG